MNQKLIELLDKRPSVIRNSFVIGLVQLLSWIIGTSLFIVGISILIHNFVYDELLARFDIVKELDNTLMNSIGISSLVVGLLLFAIIRLCKMLIKRNLFLLELDEWRYEWEEKEEGKNKQ
jgi:hypothetical protein